jgi:hypothetical protein
MMFRPGNIGHLGRLGLVAASQPSLVAQALAILAKYGSAANLYIPGVGAISGITAGNWIDSTGVTSATVDSTIGLVVSAGKAIGAELYTSGANGFTSLAGISGANATVALSGSGVLITCAGPNNAAARGEFSISGLTTGNVYLIEIKWRSLQNTSGGSQGVFSWTAFDTPSNQLTPGTTTCRVRASSSTGLIRMYSGLNVSNQAGDAIVVDSISIRELPGAHLTQSTSANRPVLRQSGGVYAWDFVSSDGFGATLAMTNAGFICSGIKFNSTLGSETILQNGATAANVRGVWLIKIVSSGIRIGISNGTDIVTALTPAINVSSPSVIEGFWDASSVSAAVNGATPTTSARTGNEAPANLTTSIGKNLSDSFPLSGQMFGLIYLSVLPTPSERATLRQFIASLSGITL